MAVSQRAIFIDKDGTLVENVPYNVDPQRVVLTAGALDGLAQLTALGYLLIVVSNQPGVAHGVFPETALAAVNDRLQRLLAAGGVSLAGFYFCPHHRDGRLSRYAIRCQCRKPAPGLLWAAANIHDIDLSASWLIGDILDDVEAGARAGCRTVLIDNGNETEWVHGPYREPHFMARDLADAARWIARAPSLGARPRRVAT